MGLVQLDADLWVDPDEVVSVQRHEHHLRAGGHTVDVLVTMRGGVIHSTEQTSAADVVALLVGAPAARQPRRRHAFDGGFWGSFGPCQVCGNAEVYVGHFESGGRPL